MLVRLVSGLTGLAIVLPILYYGGVGVSLLVGLVVVVAMAEWASMTTMDLPGARPRARAVLIPAGLALHLAVTHGPESARVAAVAVAVMVGLLAPMFGQVNVGKAGTEAVRNVTGLVYVPLCLAPLVALRGREDGAWMLLYLFAATWLGDTGAYFAGRAFGKTPLFARVSPKKTVEGALGGVLLSGVGGFLFAKLGHLPFGVVECVLLTMALDVMGVLGDLAESLLKRAWNVKDSGWIMPGHGGILDRVDSLCFTAPALWLWLAYRGGG
ncbi:MAG: hypothetical protein EXR71_16100 [Myxococcales bacterium]|nr:hypothetical protein [Myxococcales bacterium]